MISTSPPSVRSANSSARRAAVSWNASHMLAASSAGGGATGERTPAVTE
ncbi:MAG TPA: hypothetical protein VLP43_08925 [Solirubrobacteraceae bacterium]|nr:hypothetical protein [Solirubrobacteraceae bacterium]